MKRWKRPTCNVWACVDKPYPLDHLGGRLLAEPCVSVGLFRYELERPCHHGLPELRDGHSVCVDARMKHTSCRVCDHSPLLEYLDLGTQPLANAFIKPLKGAAAPSELDEDDEEKEEDRPPRPSGDSRGAEAERMFVAALFSAPAAALLVPPTR